MQLQGGITTSLQVLILCFVLSQLKLKGFLAQDSEFLSVEACSGGLIVDAEVTHATLAVEILRVGTKVKGHFFNPEQG